jgi:hypothetical protein
MCATVVRGIGWRLLTMEARDAAVAASSGIPGQRPWVDLHVVVGVFQPQGW